MRARNAKDDEPVPVKPAQSTSNFERTYTLAESASLLGVSYDTARRLLLAVGVQRYSTGVNGQPIFPGSKLERFQRVRFTYVITTEDLARVQALMRGRAA